MKDPAKARKGCIKARRAHLQKCHAGKSPKHPAGGEFKFDEARKDQALSRRSRLGRAAPRRSRPTDRRPPLQKGAGFFFPFASDCAARAVFPRQKPNAGFRLGYRYSQPRFFLPKPGAEYRRRKINKMSDELDELKAQSARTHGRVRGSAISAAPLRAPLPSRAEHPNPVAAPAASAWRAGWRNLSRGAVGVILLRLVAGPSPTAARSLRAGRSSASPTPRSSGGQLAPLPAGHGTPLFSLSGCLASRPSWSRHAGFGTELRPAFRLGPRLDRFRPSAGRAPPHVRRAARRARGRRPPQHPAPGPACDSRLPLRAQPDRPRGGLRRRGIGSASPPRSPRRPPRPGVRPARRPPPLTRAGAIPAVASRYLAALASISSLRRRLDAAILRRARASSGRSRNDAADRGGASPTSRPSPSSSVGRGHAPPSGR
jgi:hypothetical protein